MHFKELIVWQKAMAAAREVYRLVPLRPREETYGMRSQITRAAVSIPANIAEGWARESDKEKAQFLAIAQGSLAELETMLILCQDLGWFPEHETPTPRGLMSEVGRMLTTMRRQRRG
ncbi:MAG: four helix bundle protein [Oscillochloridaceae bacterium]|nr:four helix bundle protein [Chloroflexaceae bacterium]MDW8392022.1 four helix bundle protein [Oscillochloridaceae bacterium]